MLVGGFLLAVLLWGLGVADFRALWVWRRFCALVWRCCVTLWQSIALWGGASAGWGFVLVFSSAGLAGCFRMLLCSGFRFGCSVGFGCLVVVGYWVGAVVLCLWIVLFAVLGFGVR